MAEIRQRQTAFKVRISDLLNGKYVVQNGWEPNYMLANGKNISRANIMGVVVSKQSNELSQNEILILDDGSGRISARSFEERNFFHIKVGDIVLLIGRPREYNGEIYIVPEIVKALDNKGWVNVRNTELGIVKAIDARNEMAETINTEKNLGTGIDRDYGNDLVIEEQIDSEEDDIHEASPAEKIMSCIKNLDNGDGADFGEVAKNVDDAEKIINDLLKRGDIFELRPGKLKLLE